MKEAGSQRRYRTDFGCGKPKTLRSRPCSSGEFAAPPLQQGLRPVCNARLAIFAHPRVHRSNLMPHVAYHCWRREWPANPSRRHRESCLIKTRLWGLITRPTQPGPLVTLAGLATRSSRRAATPIPLGWVPRSNPLASPQKFVGLRARPLTALGWAPPSSTQQSAL